MSGRKDKQPCLDNEGWTLVTFCDLVATQFRPKPCAMEGHPPRSSRLPKLISVDEDGLVAASYDGEEPLFHFPRLTALLDFFGMQADELENLP
ncbi:MAG: hypothetical protein NVS3B20_05750 [Polyangiales bacterium]